MTPRPRTVTDEAILLAALRAIGRVGPARLRLADVAREVGLVPATLVQRFGSKRGLLLALARSGVDAVEACFTAARGAHRSRLAAVFAAATEMARYMSAPEELAHGLAFLQLDVSDPAFRALAREHAVRTTAGYRRLFDEAVAARELVPCDTLRLARAVGAVAGGSLIGWGIQPEGSAEAWVRRDLGTLIDPYRRAGRTQAARRRKVARA